jgi:glycogen debranching enzyme
MIPSTSPDRTVTQILNWGSTHQERVSPADTMFVNTGRRLYVLGDIDGRFRPRSNPYDLYAFGRPQPDDPLAEKLQGVWAQPVKGFTSYGYTLRMENQEWRLEDAEIFTQSFAFAEFQYHRGDLLARRCDFAAQDLPLLFSVLTIDNNTPTEVDITVEFAVEFDLQDAWFTQLGERRNAGQKMSVEEGCLVARAELLPEQWAAAAGSLKPPQAVAYAGNAGKFSHSLRLAPGEQARLVFGLAVECQGGAPAALSLLNDNLPRSEAILEEKIALYDDLQARGPRLVSPDPALNAAFDLARANLQALEAEAPSLGRYFYAGLEMFPFWFSTDGAYSMPGALAAGLRQTAINHTKIGLDYLGIGRVPHQISPSGKAAFAGNAQETPQWVISIWDVFRYTGDRNFLARLYPGALKGMYDYVLDVIDPDGDGYPSGPGIVEVTDMGAEKLDSAAYTWVALQSLANMAETLGDSANADRARSWAQQLATHFDADWWDEPSGTYAMSLQNPGNARMPVPHWAVIIPLEVGLATPEHAAATFATLRKLYLNRWGIKHTVGNDERVWTLPTATLSRAAYRYGETGLGEEMLRHIADTLQSGSIGLFHELIPEGACIIQLWSAATFLRGVIEDMFGVSVNADEHSIKVDPRLPQSWQQASLEGLAFGDHRVNVRIESRRVQIENLPDSAPLWVEPA